MEFKSTLGIRFGVYHFVVVVCVLCHSVIFLIEINQTWFSIGTLGPKSDGTVYYDFSNTLFTFMQRLPFICCLLLLFTPSWRTLSVMTVL